jgi:hypothetical protein
MRVLASKLVGSTYLPPDEVLFYDLRRAVVPKGDTTSAFKESFELREVPSMLVQEQQFDIVTDKESLALVALKDIQEVAGGRLTDWKEEEHLGEKFLFEITKRKRRA